MSVEVVLFAALREAVGERLLRVDLPEGATGTELRARLSDLHPRHADLIRACRLAQGVEFLEDRAPLRPGEAVVLIPPVSGGNAPAPVSLTRDPLDGRLLEETARRPEAGAVVRFEGTVRSPSEGKVVLHLEYEAYEAMARAQMERIVDEVSARWPLAAVFLHHRLGRVEVGEVSVVAVASAPHRGQAFEACRALIEALKADVPIWKKEFFEDGSVWVGAPGECAHESAGSETAPEG